MPLTRGRMHSTGFSVPWPLAFFRCGICQTVVWFRPPAQWPGASSCVRAFFA